MCSPPNSMVDRMSAMIAMVRIASHNNPAQRDNNSSLDNSNNRSTCLAPSPVKASALREDIVGILRRSFERPATRSQLSDDPRKRATHPQRDDCTLSSGGRGTKSTMRWNDEAQQQRDQSVKLHVEEFVTVSHARLHNHQLPSALSQRLRTPSPCVQEYASEEAPTSRRRKGREAHKRMLRNAGFKSDNDFFDVSHKEYTEAFAKKIVQKQALQRSLTNHRRNVHPTPLSPSGRTSPLDHSPSSAARAQSPLGMTIGVGTSVSCVREALASRQGFRETIHRSPSPGEQSNSGPEKTASDGGDSDEGNDPLPQLAVAGGDVVLPTWRKALTDDEHLRKKLFSHLYTRKQKEQREARNVATAPVEVPRGKRTPLMLEGVDGLSLNPSGGSVFRLPDVSQLLRGS